MMSEALALRRPIDWSMADEWTSYIVKDRIDPISDVFRKEGAQGPALTWDPAAGDMVAEPLRALLDYWSTLCRAEALPRAELIDPLAMRRALGYVMLVDVVENGRDFRYRLFGSAIAAVSGFDMTGRLLSEHRASPYIREFSMALYRAAMQRRQAVFSQYAPAGTKVTAEWHRVTLPLTDASAAIIRMLAGAVPLARDGRIVLARI